VNVPNGHGSSPCTPLKERADLTKKGLIFVASILLQFTNLYKAKITSVDIFLFITLFDGVVINHYFQTIYKFIDKI